MTNILPDRFRELRKTMGLTQDEMGDKLGIGGKYIGMIERNDKKVDLGTSLGKLFLLLESSPIYKVADKNQPTLLNDIDEAGDYNDKDIKGKNARMIGVISWAHAGDAAVFEELPSSWQKRITTSCPDPDAFALCLRGDSMEPQYIEGDELIMMPNRGAQTGDLVVCRFKDDGILFRKVEVVGRTINLIPINQRYNVTTHTENEFEWIYPLWGMQRSLTEVTNQ